MALVNAKCTSCGGGIQFDNQKESGFCLHCGNKVIFQDAIQKVRIDSTPMIANYLKMAGTSFSAGNNLEAYNDFGRLFIKLYYKLSPPIAIKLKDAKKINAL